ncbi:MAG: multicopper oxidase domain-containing protein [Candidatus Limnocylindrales bacterium]
MSPTDSAAAPAASASDDPVDAAVAAALSRRRFLRGAALTGGGVVAAAALAACAPVASNPAWTYGPLAGSSTAPGSAPAGTALASPAASMTAMPGMSALPPGTPAGWTEHDLTARNVVRRYVGNLAPALKGIYGDATFAKLADILGAADNYPELGQKPAFAQVPNLFLTDATAPLTPTLDGDTKVFNLTIDAIDQKIDELRPPVAALGYNKQWPGPTIRVTEGDKVRATFKNNLEESTGVHFHGVEFDDFFQDGVPFVTQNPIVPGDSYTYEFTARRPGSLMYHSHHNATDQVGRGLLGAFLVEPKAPTAQETVDRDYTWISNDALGGFTINGHGFPATVPVLAASGERVRIRFMNEGVMMHPWHLHGYPMRVTHRDGYALGTAAFDCDTLGVNPGERYDVVITADRPGIWAFHCHVLPHVEGTEGMFGMVNTLIVVPEKAHVDAIVATLLA